MEQASRPPLPYLNVLVPQNSWQITAERKHSHDYRLRYRSTVDAMNICDQDARAKRRQVNDVIDTGSESLNPLQIFSVPHHVITHHGAISHEHGRVPNIGIYFAVMINQMSCEIWERGLDAVVVLLLDLCRHRQEHEETIHSFLLT